MQGSRSLINVGRRKDAIWEDRLSKAWNAILNGKGSKEDAEFVLADLSEISEFYYIADPAATGEALLRREGRREVMARILFLLDRPRSFIEELRRVAQDELQISTMETEL